MSTFSGKLNSAANYASLSESAPDLSDGMGVATQNLTQSTMETSNTTGT
jgi:hypothetical protein